jgi:hypothetical protein
MLQRRKGKTGNNHATVLRGHDLLHLAMHWAACSMAAELQKSLHFCTTPRADDMIPHKRPRQKINLACRERRDQPRQDKVCPPFIFSAGKVSFVI